MTYLSLPTCKLLHERGCTSESGYHYSNATIGHKYDDLECTYIKHLDPMQIVDSVPSEALWKEYDQISFQEIVIVPAYTFEDLCTKENAMKVFGDKWRLKMGVLLNLKLDGEDWEAVLVA